MAAYFKNFLSDDEKNDFIDALAENLPALRAKVGVSQGDLAQLIGVSRQTYCAVESGLRRMSWSTFLSLILFFDYNQATHQMLRSIDAFPYGFVDGMNKNKKNAVFNANNMFGANLTNVVNSLDEQAMHAIRTVLMIEYARCTGQNGEAVIRAFDGMNFPLFADPATPSRRTRTRKNK